MIQVELESIAREIGSLNPPELVFRAVAEGAIRSSVDGSGSQDLLDALCTDEELANVSPKLPFLLILQAHLANRRLSTNALLPRCRSMQRCWVRIWVADYRATTGRLTGDSSPASS